MSTTNETRLHHAVQATEERLDAAARALDTLNAALADARNIVTRAGAGRSWLAEGSTTAVCAAVEEHEGTLADLLADLDSGPIRLTETQAEALSAVIAPLLALLEVSRG